MFRAMIISGTMKMSTYNSTSGLQVAKLYIFQPRYGWNIIFLLNPIPSNAVLAVDRAT